MAVHGRTLLERRRTRGDMVCTSSGSLLVQLLVCLGCATHRNVAQTASANSGSSPSIDVRRGLQLPEDSLHEVLGTRNQAMGVWADGARTPGNELVIALTHRFNEVNRRADDEEFIVAWESDGETLREVERIRTSCPNVELTVPAHGPYVFESRLDLTAGALHPECSCVPSAQERCPRGVDVVLEATGNESRSHHDLASPTATHFVVAQDEWGHQITDPVSLEQLRHDISLPVFVVSLLASNVSAAAPDDPSLGCPGSYDDWLGTTTVTRPALQNAGIALPAHHVRGGWCLVRRGGCSETAKVKLCEVSGALGTIIVDHGNFEDSGDQNVLVQYSRAAGEVSTQPVIFLSRSEGEWLITETKRRSAYLVVGPTVGGPPPPGYSPGSGLIVHALGTGASILPHRSKPYPDIFGTVGWIEASEQRDLLFVCLSWVGQIRIYDISDPMVQIPLQSIIFVPCSRYGYHDYHVLDYRDQDGRFMTVFIDPDDRGNRLYYYDTDNPRWPRAVKRVDADWEAEGDGLGQVRPILPNSRHHIVTWHCSHLFCGDDRSGDKLHILDSWKVGDAGTFGPDKEIMLPMLSSGGFVRDVACTNESLCVATLTWDGVIVVDGGVPGTVNRFEVIASHIGDRSTFSGAHIPTTAAWLRFESGAQKVYASKIFPRKYYVEHGDLEMQPLNLGDHIRAMLLNEIFIVSVKDYNASQDVPDLAGHSSSSVTTTVSGRVPVDAQQNVDELEERSLRESSRVLILALAIMVCVLSCNLAIFCILYRRATVQKAAMRRRLQEASSSVEEPPVNSSIVVGRPVSMQPDDPESAEGVPLASAPSTVFAPKRERAAKVHPLAPPSG